MGASCDQVLQVLAATDREQVPALNVVRLDAKQIREGGLKSVDVLVHPGGSGSGRGRALESDGRTAVREFVRQGGGFLGICAVQYLATNDYSWSLGLIDAKVVDRRHWVRGKGTVSLRLSPQSQRLFRHDDQRMELFYAQGPLLGRHEWDDPTVPNYESLALYDSEIAKNGAPRGVMIGTSAIVRGDYGKGRVICFSPHPELTENFEHLLRKAVDWIMATDETNRAASVAVDDAPPAVTAESRAVTDARTGTKEATEPLIAYVGTFSSPLAGRLANAGGSATRQWPRHSSISGEIATRGR